MKTCRITVVEKVWHKHLSTIYETPSDNYCNINIGDTYISVNGLIPKDFCKSAWKSVGPFVRALAKGEENFFDGWMKNPKSAMVSCNDGFRPVSFYIEVID